MVLFIRDILLEPTFFVRIYSWLKNLTEVLLNKILLLLFGLKIFNSITIKIINY